MELKKAIKQLESSKEFKEFKKKDKTHKLAHAFTILDKEEQQDWQIGYYSKKSDKVIVFTVGKEITISPEEEVFKKPGHKVELLDLKNVSITLEEAIKKSEEIVKKKYSAEIINKTIVILQCLKTEMYNLTLVSQSFNIINIKINSKNGKVLHESKQSIIELGKR
ncbi:hypothetical protein CMO90_00465 [Candidatus Woesearchaeota archaeon]|jgi:hypothetical protein|nr:hypothetical protein [Candidatus Woesearchaeota archaeon]|tara:strand:+ start:93 stop:587 length:495 start_codon:yes stop_codon:yes gene_type:complete